MEIIRKNIKRLSSPSYIFVIFVVFVAVCVPFCNGDGQSQNLKDITFARPKHLRYPSYKSLLQENTTSHQDPTPRASNDHLNSEESQNIPKVQKQPRSKNNSTSRGGKSSENSSETLSHSNSANVKRALPKVHHTGPGGSGDSSHSASARYGSPLSLQKTPPDLQFGLAFTVPFVSLSTDKLINTFSGKSHHGGNDVSSILKLNIKGLIVAAVVGIAAFLFLPGLLSTGGLGLPGFGGGGWGGSLLDSILPQVGNLFPGLLDHVHGGHHGGYPDSPGGWADNGENYGSRPFGFQDHYEYNGVHNHNRMDAQGLLREKQSRRAARSGKNNSTINSEQLMKNLFKTVTTQAKKYVSQAEGCLHLQVCQKAVSKGKVKSDGKNGDRNGRKDEDDEGLDFIGLIESITDNDLVKGSPLSDGVKNAHEYGEKHGNCKPYEKNECKI